MECLEAGKHRLLSRRGCRLHTPGHFSCLTLTCPKISHFESLNPDRPFHNFKASKSDNWRILCSTSETSLKLLNCKKGRSGNVSIYVSEQHKALQSLDLLALELQNVRSGIALCMHCGWSANGIGNEVKCPTRFFLNWDQKFLLANPIFMLRWTYFWRSFVTYVDWKSSRVCQGPCTHLVARKPVQDWGLRST